jgi:D-arabinose 1-dehydrogenase-like Zn-dependent alcohol dehydrogenase
VDGVDDVIEAPDGCGFAPGDGVILNTYEFCCVCRHCLAGDQPLCTRAHIFGEHRDGTFAEEIVVPVTALVRLSPQADPHQAACLGVACLTA